MRQISCILFIVLFICFGKSYSQNLEDILNNNPQDSLEKKFIDATFKSTRLINSHTVEMPAKKEMVFCISHRFGLLKDGFKTFYGLDESSNIRFGFDYGISDWLTIGIGRSRFELYDGSLQLKLVRQQKGLHNIPVSINFYSAVEANLADPLVPTENFTIYRFSYTNQFLLASKITNKFSLQLMPTYIHRNLVKTGNDKNNIVSMGFGGRYKLTKRLAVTAEYYYTPSNMLTTEYYNPLSIGLDIETGGHVFQIFITNAEGMTEKSFIPQTTYSWKEHEILLGFNISRVFSFK